MAKLMVNKSFLCYHFLKQQMLKWKLRKSKKKKKRKIFFTNLLGFYDKYNIKDTLKVSNTLELSSTVMN